jgi:excisionase family DNA binding protein
MNHIMTLEEVASYLRLSRDTVYRLTQAGTIPAAKVGNQWRYRKEEVDEWLAKQKHSPGETEDGKQK